MLLSVRLTPNAKHAACEKTIDLLGNEVYNVRVTAQPVDGKANKALIELLAKHFSIPKSSISIKRGHKSRHKIVELSID